MTATPPVGGRDIWPIDRALLTAHLLTGSLQQAEELALQGIESWNPREEPDEVLFQKVVDAAARAEIRENPRLPDAWGRRLPKELEAVLQLAPRLRRCFVLRILVGLPSQACAQLLQLDSGQIDECTCAALRCLAAS